MALLIRKNKQTKEKEKKMGERKTEKRRGLHSARSQSGCVYCDSSKWSLM